MAYTFELDVFPESYLRVYPRIAEKLLKIDNLGASRRSGFLIRPPIGPRTRRPPSTRQTSARKVDRGRFEPGNRKFAAGDRSRTPRDVSD